MRRSPGLLACLCMCVAAPVEAASAASTPARSSVAGTVSDAPVPVAASNTPPAGRTLSPNRVLAIAAALPKVRAARAKYRGSYGGAYLKGPFRWQVSYFSRNGKQEIGQVIIGEALSSPKVLEQWTG